MMKHAIYILILLVPNCILCQGFVDPCGTGLQPFDHSHQLLFDSCFRVPSPHPKKICTITITDSMFTTGKQEEIKVTFDDKGRVVELLHAMGKAEKSTCGQIVCAYGNNLFFSTHIQGADSAITNATREYTNPNGNYREDIMWFQADTSRRYDTKTIYYRNVAGKDSCIKFYSQRDGTTIQNLTSLKMLDDTTEERIYMNVKYRWNDSKGDTSYGRRSVTYNKRKQIVRREYYLFKTRVKYIWTYEYNSAGRLISHTYKDAYGKDERFTIERNREGLPVAVRCYGFMYYTIYRFNWD
jgi:hypothetical protein